MQRLPAINPGDASKYPDAEGTFDVGAANEGSKILFYNESPYNIDLDFLNGSTDVLHAWEAAYWILDADTKQIQWQLDANSLNVAAPPVSAVFMTLYGPQEKLSGQYPMALVRQASVGNVGGIATTTTNQVINDGNTLQEVIEATLQGHSSSDVIINNDGSYTLKGAGLLAVAGVLTHILGNMQVDGQGAVGTPLSTGITLAVQPTAANKVGLGIFPFSGQTSDLFEVQDSSFVPKVYIDSNLILHVVNTLQAAGITASGNIVANGGMNINTIRDDVNGNLALDLSNGDGSVKFPQSINLGTAQTINGSVAGSLTWATPIWGAGLKVLVAIFGGYNSAVQNDLALPSVMSRGIGINLVDTIAIGVKSSGVQKSVKVVTALASTGGTYSALVNAFNQATFGHTTTIIDDVLIGVTGGAACDGVFLLIGM